MVTQSEVEVEAASEVTIALVMAPLENVVRHVVHDEAAVAEEYEPAAHSATAVVEPPLAVSDSSSPFQTSAAVVVSTATPPAAV